MLEASRNSIQEFKLDKQLIITMKGCLVILIAALAFSLALPFLSSEENSNSSAVFFTTIFCTIIFGCATGFTWLSLEQLSYVDVVIDDDGIWYKHLGKNQGLIPWNKIYKIKERAFLQCLDLLGANENTLLRVEYQLYDFEKLRNILNEKILIRGREVNRSSFSKSPLFHLFNWVGILGLSALNIYVAASGAPIFGLMVGGVIVIAVFYEYCVTVTSINLIESLS